MARKTLLEEAPLETPVSLPGFVVLLPVVSALVVTCPQYNPRGSERSWGMRLGRPTSNAGTGQELLPLVISGRANRLTNSNTLHEISLQKHLTGAFILGDLPDSLDLQARANPTSRPEHLPSVQWGRMLSCVSGFSVSVFSWFCLVRRPYLGPRELFCASSCCSDHAGCCPTGQGRTRMPLSRNRSQSVSLALGCVQ